MGHRLSKIYTRTGDQGETGLGDGSRINKSDLRIKCLGLVDELNAAIGLVLSFEKDQSISLILTQVQHALFDLGGEICIPERVVIESHYVEGMEISLDKFNAELKPLKEFVLPGGCHASAFAHQARTICRRAECELIILAQTSFVNPESLCYINRLSDLLFVIARYINALQKHPDILWQPKLHNE